jgi:tryptophan synthase alpha subunit
MGFDQKNAGNTIAIEMGLEFSDPLVDAEVKRVRLCT